MIASLRGVIIANTEDVIVECHGVGYGVHVSRSDSAQLIQGKEATLYIYEHIKEDAYDLYGFLSSETKELFELLLSVKNVGPKSALALLDIGSPSDVRLAIAGGDIKRIQTAKGVGKRAAEQIIVELRDKVGVPVGVDAENLVYRSGVNQTDEALQALVALGYSEADALTALQNIDAKLSVEQRIKQALKER
jgi:Holliday junction DNA helicase RuvA